MKDIFIMPKNIKIGNHTAQRFLQRIIQKDSYTAEDEEVAVEVIHNILKNRALKQRSLGNGKVQIKYRNAVFVYDVESEFIITVYLDDTYPKRGEKVEWIYKFPAGFRFNRQISPDKKLKLITHGFIPIRKNGHLIVGQVDEDYFTYDPKHNYISPLDYK